MPFPLLFPPPTPGVMGGNNTGAGWGMGKKRIYTDAEIARALAILDAHGGNVSAAAREAGVPRKTLAGWARGEVRRASGEDVAFDRHQMIREILDGSIRLCHQILGILPERLAETRPKDLAVIYGIFADKTSNLAALVRQQDAPADDPVAALVAAVTPPPPGEQEGDG